MSRIWVDACALQKSAMWTAVVALQGKRSWRRMSRSVTVAPASQESFVATWVVKVASSASRVGSSDEARWRRRSLYLSSVSAVSV